MSHSFAYLSHCFVYLNLLYVFSLFVMFKIPVLRCCYSFYDPLYVLLSVLCVLCFCTVSCLFSLCIYIYMCFFSICVQCTDHCHRVETQLPLINIVSYPTFWCGPVIVSETVRAICISAPIKASIHYVTVRLRKHVTSLSRNFASGHVTMCTRSLIFPVPNTVLLRL
jgi:hypothetical protein